MAEFTQLIQKTRMILPRTVAHPVLHYHPHLAVVCRHIRFRHRRLLPHLPLWVVCHILPPLHHLPLYLRLHLGQTER